MIKKVQGWIGSARVRATGAALTVVCLANGVQAQNPELPAIPGFDPNTLTDQFAGSYGPVLVKVLGVLLLLGLTVAVFVMVKKGAGARAKA